MSAPWDEAVHRLIAAHAAEFKALLRQARRDAAAAERAPRLFEVLSDPFEDAVGAMHHDAGDTERGAAWAVFPRTGTQRAKVLEAFACGNCGADGFTDEELAHYTGLYLYSAAPRRHELVVGGWLEDSGTRRLTQRGLSAIVWRITVAGFLAYRAGLDLEVAS